MPELDRPITLILYDRWEQGPQDPTEYEVWSFQNDEGTRPDFDDVVGLLRVRSFFIRWREDLERADARLIRIRDEFGYTWFTDAVATVRRRRFLSLTMTTPLIAPIDPD